MAGLSNGVKKNRKMNEFILSNNPKVLASYPTARRIDGGPYAVLLECRRMVHEFYPLLTHPLMGDIRLIRNPFRTVLFGGKRHEVDLISLIWIEESIDRIHLHFREDQRVEHRRDYQIIDFDLFQTAIKH
jgi:hypothetical protein